ncbi:alpha/beta fold hydrolase [Pseudomonas sp. Irchel 3A7]|uniref:alpha/beta fold hydrolase n=1 Tax=Pseudomonas sp. Irchel 3A7 TaxID=2008913 RepID=UPI000BA3AA70|nr:alpha/beta fold hydrolase [Pseudomonas sp. Irchel 3A7]
MSAAEKAPVIFINGLIGTLKNQLIEGALEGRPCAAPDLLGYGSLASETTETIDIMAQVIHLEEWIEQHFAQRKVHLVGHSVGGVVAYVFALRYPQRVLSVISVEGNFSLKDAFWSSSVASLPRYEVEEMLAGYVAHPDTWLARSELKAESELVSRAVQWLKHQPATTLQAMARSVVAVTGSSDYPNQLQALFGRLPVRLLAGEKSLAGWDIPDWARSMAEGVVVMPGRGHLMMLEDPIGFGKQVAKVLAQIEEQNTAT